MQCVETLHKAEMVCQTYVQNHKLRSKSMKKLTLSLIKLYIASKPGSVKRNSTVTFDKLFYAAHLYRFRLVKNNRLLKQALIYQDQNARCIFRVQPSDY
jgi:hypothetical protein